MCSFFLLPLLQTSRSSICLVFLLFSHSRPLLRMQFGMSCLAGRSLSVCWRLEGRFFGSNFESKRRQQMFVVVVVVVWLRQPTCCCYWLFVFIVVVVVVTEFANIVSVSRAIVFGKPCLLLLLLLLLLLFVVYCCSCCCHAGFKNC